MASSRFFPVSFTASMPDPSLLSRGAAGCGCPDSKARAQMGGPQGGQYGGPQGQQGGPQVLACLSCAAAWHLV